MSEPATDEDAAVIAELQRGNARAYGTLVRRHQDRAYTFALRLLGRPQEAEDAVQDAFIRAYNSLPDFRGESRFSTWLTRIVYNVCMTRLTRRKPAGPSLDDLTAEDQDTLRGPDPSPTPLELMEELEMRAAVNAAVDTLPERYRAVILLHYLQEEPCERIAAMLEVPVGTVKTHLFRARALLRSALERSLKERTAA